jgi:hypothetical protein
MAVSLMLRRYMESDETPRAKTQRVLPDSWLFGLPGGCWTMRKN